jgi:hypothetical protein
MTRKTYTIPIAYANIASSATSTVSQVAVDLANYFPVGKREIKFVIAVTTDSTITAAANVTILEGASTASANSTSTVFTNVTAYDGSTLTYTSTADTSTAFEAYGMVTKRYLMVRYNAAQATSGSKIGIVVCAQPLVRAA